jgi:hypothetical protein
LTSPYASPLQIRQGVEEVVEVRIRGLMGGAATTAVCDRRIGVHRVRGEVPCGLTWLPYASTASEAGSIGCGCVTQGKDTFVAPRSIWNGTITFGLVNVPVKLYTATESKTVHFHEVHAKDGAKIEHRRICPKEDKEVDYDDIVKGYEVSPDKYVVLENEEVKAAAGDRGKVVHLSEFVDAAEIDAVFYEKTYYVGSRDAEDAYRLLQEALHSSPFARSTK